MLLSDVPSHRIYKYASNEYDVLQNDVLQNNALQNDVLQNDVLQNDVLQYDVHGIPPKYGHKNFRHCRIVYTSVAETPKICRTKMSLQ